jgi:hypothetical protein
MRNGQLRSLLETVMSDNRSLRTRIRKLMSDGTELPAGNPDDEYQVRLIGPSRQPMINRMDLRDNVKQLFGRSRVVLTVRGDGQSGKSHSYLLLSHVTGEVNGYEPHRFDFSPPSTGDTAKPLLAMICKRLGIENVTDYPKWTTATRFAGEMMDDFVGLYRNKFENSRTTRIFVIDGLDRFEPTSDVYVLVSRLALEVAHGQLPKTQLVLIGYTGIFDPGIKQAVLVEDIKKITATDLRIYFDGMACELGRRLSPGRIDEMTKAAMTGEPGLAELSERVRQQALDLIRSA